MIFESRAKAGLKDIGKNNKIKNRDTKTITCSLSFLCLCYFT